MNGYERYCLLLLITVGAYFAASKYIFDQVYSTTKVVVDEVFHIPQGEEYCKGNYTPHPKITTLPGLYFVSSIVLGSYGPYQNLCDTYTLRFVNLVASCVNLILFSVILRYVYFIETSTIKTVIQALNLALLPPLYFFSHVYYSDTLSVTFVLLFLRLCFTCKYKFPIISSGLFCVLARQTNIAWVAMVFGHKILDLLLKSSRVFGNRYVSTVNLSPNSLLARDIDSSKLKRYYSLGDLVLALRYHVRTSFIPFFKFVSMDDWIALVSQGIVIIVFLGFVYVNGGLVAGDKEAHTASIHLPQLLYFLIFYGVFGLPYVLVKLPSTLRLIYANKLNVLQIALAMVIIVSYNTVVHPYLLADNRHFTFYIWNRWYGKYLFAKYATIPVYVFLLFSLYDNLINQNCISFLLPYCISLFLVVGLQRMIEVRYFLLPYIIVRLRFVRTPMYLVLFEFFYYMAINAAVFYVFFTKEVTWYDFDYPQRIIW